MRRLHFAVIGALVMAGSASAYPEFQKYSQKVSGRFTNCAMCHVHPDGPDGLKPGQIGSLEGEELDRLGRARAAFEPGQDVHSPILNAFGNALVCKVGRRQFIALRLHPEKLPGAIGMTSDLDGDGIPDAQEFLDGTHPMQKYHGSPWVLFKINLIRNIFHIVMITLATILGVFGLKNLLLWFEHNSPATTDEVVEAEE